MAQWLFAPGGFSPPKQQPEDQETHANGIANGVTNGVANGATNGITNGKPKEAPTRMQILLQKNREWAHERVYEDPKFFARLCDQQSPEYLWIGCADSRVPANTIVGLDPGEVFVQRNVGNQAMHTDLNCQACIEYAVTALKVKVIIVCGHYNCGAVKGALKLPSKSAGLVNCWISDIRECRNQHTEDLKGLSEEEQVARLCEYNVLRQVFHVCTSPTVQAAWDAGQELHVHGVCYSLKDGLLRNLVGPLSHDTDIGTHDKETFLSESLKKGGLYSASGKLAASPDALTDGGSTSLTSAMNTASMASKLNQHLSWARGNDGPKKAATAAVAAVSGQR